jgi:hypothetical protein
VIDWDFARGQLLVSTGTPSFMPPPPPPPLPPHPRSPSPSSPQEEKWTAVSHADAEDTDAVAIGLAARAWLPLELLLAANEDVDEPFVVASPMSHNNNNNNSDAGTRAGASAARGKVGADCLVDRLAARITYTNYNQLYYEGTYDPRSLAFRIVRATADEDGP